MCEGHQMPTVILYMKERLSFSGHDKFACRQFWLKKGFNHTNQQKTFNSAAVIDLGVGRNMVTAVRYWIQAFGIVDDNGPSELGTKLLADEGYDPYIEDLGTLWLLHYSLVTTEKASLYSLVFNDFLRQKVEFTRDALFHYISDYCQKRDIYYNPSSLKNDIAVFISNYALPEKSKGVEADFSGLLYELQLLNRIQRSGGWFKIESSDRPDLAARILLFCLLYTYPEQQTFSFRDLLSKKHSIGRVFCLTPNGLHDKLNELTMLYPNELVLSEDAGVQVLQIKQPIEPWQLLKDHYEN